MADYLPHTPAEIDEMLAFLGMDSLDQLFAHIPAGRSSDPGTRPARGHERARRGGALRALHLGQSTPRRAR